MPMRPPMLGAAHGGVQDARRPDRERGSAAERGYDRTWRRLRLVVLAAEPLCRFCQAAGQVTAAAVVDHIEPVRQRPELRLVRSNLRALCKPCHDAHTARQTGRTPAWAGPGRGRG